MSLHAKGQSVQTDHGKVGVHWCLSSAEIYMMLTPDLVQKGKFALSFDKGLEIREPIFQPITSKELLAVIPESDILRELAETEDRFSFFPGHGQLIERLLADLSPPAPPPLLERRPRLESFIAALVALFLAGEWFVERRLSRVQRL